MNFSNIMALNDGTSDDSRFARRMGAAGSVVLHALLLVLVVFFVHGSVQLAPPKPKVVVTLMLQPPPPPKPATPQPPPPKPQPAPTPKPAPALHPIESQTMSSLPMPTAPPPPAEKLAPAKPLSEPQPTGPQPGVVGYRVSSRYKQMLEGQIRSNLHYPVMAARQGREGTALVKVRMKRDGTVEQVTLVHGTGTPALDREAQAVFKRIRKFPPLPKNFLPTASEFQFEIPITFKLTNG